MAVELNIRPRLTDGEFLAFDPVAFAAGARERLQKVTSPTTDIEHARGIARGGASPNESHDRLGAKMIEEPRPSLDGAHEFPFATVI